MKKKIERNRGSCTGILIHWYCQEVMYESIWIAIIPRDKLAGVWLGLHQMPVNAEEIFGQTTFVGAGRGGGSLQDLTCPYMVHSVHSIGTYGRHNDRHVNEARKTYWDAHKSIFKLLAIMKEVYRPYLKMALIKLYLI